VTDDAISRIDGAQHLGTLAEIGSDACYFSPM